MSAKKFYSMVDHAVNCASTGNWRWAKKLGDLFKVLYSKIESVEDHINKRHYISRIAGRNLGKRIRPNKSIF